MGRLHLFEIHDQPWCPPLWRDLTTELLGFLSERLHCYDSIASELLAALRVTGERRILDLCSGNGGPSLLLREELEKGLGERVELLLSDLYPNRTAIARIRELRDERIGYCAEPVDANAPPRNLSGFRTLFTSFHHFRPEEARRILDRAVADRAGIGVFEITGRHAPYMIQLAFVPLATIVSAPLVRPFRWSRLLWSWLVPVLPLLHLWDGLISGLRTYSPRELRRLVASIDTPGYVWKVGRTHPDAFLNSVTFLIGYPVGAADEVTKSERHGEKG